MINPLHSSQGRKCRWCGIGLPDYYTDNQCDSCWAAFRVPVEILQRMIDAKRNLDAAVKPSDEFPNDGKLHRILSGDVEVGGQKWSYTGTCRNWQTLPGEKPPSRGPIYEITALNLPFKQRWASGLGESEEEARAKACAR